MKYTAEQVEACILAYKAGDLNYCRQGICDLLAEYAALLREQSKGTLTGTTDDGKHYGVHGSVESINVLSDYLHRLEQEKGGQCEAVRIVCDWRYADPFPRFIEAETPNGKSISLPWHDREDGLKEFHLYTAPRESVPDGCVLVAIERGEGYEDVHPELVAEDCMSSAAERGWRYRVLTNSTAPDKGADHG